MARGFEIGDRSDRDRRRYLGFGGGFGTPVVSYAPLPILQDSASLVIIMRDV